jgi:plastocyanin domain-containing protein
MVAAIFGYLYFRRRPMVERDEDGTPIQQFELKLLDGLTPSEVRVTANKPVRLLVHRYETEPAEEIFEIDELSIYELLPAATTTIISFLPKQRGTFKIILSADREIGRLIVD